MFGFSFIKILLLGIIIFSIWKIAKYIQRKPPSFHKDTPHKPMSLKQCSVCGIYSNEQNISSCSEATCPYRS